MPEKCTVCIDGWIPPTTVGGRAQRCECRTRLIAATRIRDARIPERYKNCRIGTYRLLPGAFEKSQAAAMLAASAFVDHARKQRGALTGLLFIGLPGVGKTHLAVSVLNELLASANPLRCLFRDYRELLSDIRYSFNPDAAVTEETLLEPVFTADVLVIDELGAERATDWVLDTVSRILNTRYNRCRATILTTNYPDLAPTDVDVSRLGRGVARSGTLGDRVTEPMRSRLHEMCRVVEIQGEDFRSRPCGAAEVA